MGAFHVQCPDFKRMPVQKQHFIDINELIDAKENIAPLVPIEILKSPYYRFDLSRHNPHVAHIDMAKPETLRTYIEETLTAHRCGWGFGGWGEDRAFYQTHPFFKDKPGDHSIHLGMDIWLPADTPIYSPFTGTVHAFKDNSLEHTYGPSIITEHQIGGVPFYIMFSHLSPYALDGINEGRLLRSGDQVATVGSEEDNAEIPPHFHIQLITDLAGHRADFPEVARLSEKNKYLNICHNPESLLSPFMVRDC